MAQTARIGLVARRSIPLVGPACPDWATPVTMERGRRPAEHHEVNLTTGQATLRRPWTGQLTSIRQVGDTLPAARRLSRERHECGQAGPFGGTRLTSGALGSDRLFTAQTRDYVDTQVTTNNDAFYFFESRYYGATIGKFHVPDTVVPDS